MVKNFFVENRSRLAVVREFPFEDPDCYREFLAQTYHYVVHTTRLGALVASRLGVDREREHLRFLSAASAEEGHHLLLQHDLAALSSQPDDHPELAVTAAIYMTQHYRATHSAPTSVLGQVLALEGLAAVHGEELHDRVREAHGAKASTFIKVHAAEDPGHLEGVLAEIGKLPASEVELIKQNFLHSCDYYRLFLSEIRNQSTPS